MENTYNNQNENTDNEISLRKYINILISEKTFIIFITFISSFFGISYSLLQKPVWKGDFKMYTKDKKSSGSFSNSSGGLGNPLNVIKRSNDDMTKLSILKSSSVLKPAYEFVKNNDPNLNLSFKDWINKKTSIKYETADVLVVSYRDSNKELLLSALTKIKDQFQEYSLSNRKKNLSQSINFLTNQKKIFSDKYQKSLAEFNKFTIENGLGNIDGFLATELTNNLNNSQTTTNKPTNNNPIGFNNKINEPNKAGQRYAIQFANLESKEALYNQLSSRLKPNSQTMINLSIDIENLKEALKRPNEILIKYRDLESTALRNQSLFYGIIDELEFTKLEQVKQIIPWVVISPPSIDELRESPKRSQIVITYFLFGLLFSSILSIIKHNKKGIVYEKEDFESFLGIKFDGYVREDINLNSLFIKNLKDNLNQGDQIAILNLEDNDSDNSIYFLKDSKIKFLSLKDLEELENFRNIVLFVHSGKITLKSLTRVKEYLKFCKSNIKGSLFKNIPTTQNREVFELPFGLNYIVEEKTREIKIFINKFFQEK